MKIAKLVYMLNVFIKDYVPFLLLNVDQLLVVCTGYSNATVETEFPS